MIFLKSFIFDRGKTIEFQMKPGHFFRQNLFLFIACSIGIVLFLWTFNTSGDTVVDFGREVYIPWQLATGKVLYDDIHYRHGPLSPYINAFCFCLFGSSIMTLKMTNTLLLLMICYFLYKLIIKISNRHTATISLLLFLSLFAFGMYVKLTNYNYLTPYSHEVTHGVLLSILSLYFWQKWLESTKMTFLVISGLFMGLLFSTRPEVFFALSIGIFSGTILLVRNKLLTFNKGLLSVSILLACILIAELGLFLILLTKMPWQTALNGVLGIWRFVFTSDITTQHAYKVWAGTLHPLKSITIISLWTFIWLFIFFIGTRLSQKKLIEKNVKEIFFDFISLILLFLALYLTLSISNPFTIFSPLPLLLAISILLSMNWLYKSQDEETVIKLTGFLVLSIFALFMLSRMMLNTNIYHYGFVMAMPGVIALIVFLSYWLAERTGLQGLSLRKYEIIIVCSLLLLLFPHFIKMNKIINYKSYPISSFPNQLTDYEERADILIEMIYHINGLIKKDQTLAVCPEGSFVNFLTRHENPARFIETPYSNFLRQGEDVILDSYASNPPDFILLVHRAEFEYGVNYFGQGYARKFMAWIEQNYHEDYLVGVRPFNKENKFGVLLLQRNDLL